MGIPFAAMNFLVSLVYAFSFYGLLVLASAIYFYDFSKLLNFCKAKFQKHDSWFLSRFVLFLINESLGKQYIVPTYIDLPEAMIDLSECEEDSACFVDFKEFQASSTMKNINPRNHTPSTKDSTHNVLNVEAPYMSDLSQYSLASTEILPPLPPASLDVSTSTYSHFSEKLPAEPLEVEWEDSDIYVYKENYYEEFSFKDTEDNGMWNILKGFHHDSLIESSKVSIQDDKTLGKGSFGQVYRGKYQEEDVAFKSFPSFASCLRETSLGFEIPTHPNLLRVFGVTRKWNKSYLVMELFPEGSLKSIMKSGKIFDDNSKISFCKQLSSALYHMHLNGVLHCDVALRNILYETSKDGSGTSRVILSDFGMSRRISSNSQAAVIAPRWASPELVKTWKHSAASDVWALGISILEIFQNGKMPYDKLEKSDVMARLTRFLGPDYLFCPQDIIRILDYVFVKEESRWSLQRLQSEMYKL